MTRRFLTSHRATQVAFGVIIAFVTAQMAWWIYFQAVYVGQVSNTTIEGLEREALTLNALLAEGAVDQVRALLAEQHHLKLNAAGTLVEVDEETVAAFVAEHRRVVRMFAFEGPFFVLVVMLGLFIISRNLRLERELKRRQSNFLDAIGHEYKTPISTLRLLIETMQLRNVKPEKLQDYLRSMSAEVDRLEHTGQQVLATARLEAGALPQGQQQRDLGQLVDEVLARSGSGLRSRGAHLTLDLNTEPLPVVGSYDEIAVILDNLLDNALKYTPGPDKRIAVRVGRSGRWATLSVEDNGPGIPESERANVTERFYRVGSELTRTTTGVGLGLYLVRRATEALGGRLRLGDGAHGGTLVTVLLPLQAVTETSTGLDIAGAAS